MFETHDNFSELIRKISPTNNFFQFIDQVTIKFRFRLALLQKGFKSDLEF